MTHPASAPAPLSEDAARTLLTAAAETIDVAATGPLAHRTPSRSRRALTVLASAAAVVLLAASLVVVHAHDRPAARPTSPAPGPVTTVDRSRDFRLGFDQIPSMLGQTEESATAALRAMGAVVSTSLAASCAPAGTPVGTDPHTGTIVEPGDRVSIRVSSGRYFSCGGASDDPRAYALLEYAVSGGPAPAAAPGVDLRAAAAALRRWAAESGRYYDNRLIYPSPSMTTHSSTSISLKSPGCDRLDAAAYRSGSWLVVTIDQAPATGSAGTAGLPTLGPCQTVDLRYDTAGRIARVVLPPGIQLARHPGAPDVVGNSLTFADARLRAAGYRVAATPQANCGPTGVVTRQLPIGSLSEGSTVTLTWTASRGPCHDPVPTPFGR